MSTTTQAGQRILSLLDENSFVEIGARVCARSTDFNLKQQETPGDGVITGYGVIDGKPVYVYSQDASVLGGSIGEMHAKKIQRVYELAAKTGAPVIALLDSAGLRLQEAADALNALAEVYKSQTLLSGVIPQIAAVFGNCGGGLAVSAAMADFTFMEEKANLFVNSPNAIAGNTKEKLDTSSADFQSANGTVDVVGDEETVLGSIRELISLLPSNNEDEGDFEECTDDLNRVCEDLAACAEDGALALSVIADDGYFFETKENFAKEMVTGFIRLNGQTVGCVANRSVLYDEEGNESEKFDSVLTVDGCAKAAEFISFCDAFELPLLTLTNASGFEASAASEKGIARATAAMASAFADATVPKLNVITGKAFGTAYTVMNSKGLGADITICWPDAQISAMEPKLAAMVICDGKDAEKIAETEKSYAELQASSASAAARGYVDEIVAPEDTRKYIIAALEMLFTKREARFSRKHSVI